MVKKLLFIVIILFLVTSQSWIIVQSSPQVSASAQVLKISHAAYLRPTLEYGLEIATFNNLVQKDLAIIMYYMDWRMNNQTTYFDNYLVNKIRDTFGDNSPVVMLTWDPINGKTPGCIRNYPSGIPNNDILAGACDNYIRGFANALKARPERYILRFAHEMNIQDHPWWPGHFDQDASAFVQVWRHVHDVFSSQDVPNVEWLWSTAVDSYPDVPWNDRNNYYPGDVYVDWVGISGYNWYTYLGWPWWTFTDIYDSTIFNYTLKDYACRYAKPQLIGEFSSVDGPGGNASKAAWITNAFQTIPQHPFVRGAVWFNDYAYTDPKDADFRVTTGTAANGSVSPLPAGSGAWTNAYKQSLANPIFSSSLPSLETTTPPTTYCGNGEPTFQAEPASSTISLNQSSTHIITGMLFDQSLALTLKVPPGSNLTGLFQPATITAPWGQTNLNVTASPEALPGTYTVFVQGNGIDLISLTISVQSRALIPIVIR